MLYKIEESFRCMKSSLDLRPVYHWTERRIKGHIMLCFFKLLRIKSNTEEVNRGRALHNGRASD